MEYEESVLITPLYHTNEFRTELQTVEKYAGGAGRKGSGERDGYVVKCREKGVDADLRILVRLQMKNGKEKADYWVFENDFNKKSAERFIAEWDGARGVIKGGEEGKKEEKNIGKMECVKHERTLTVHVELMELMESPDKGKHMIKYRVRAPAGAPEAFVLTRHDGEAGKSDAWYFVKDFNAESARAFVKQWEKSRDPKIVRMREGKSNVPYEDGAKKRRK